MIYSIVDKYKGKIVFGDQCTSVDVKMTYLFVNIRFTTAVAVSTSQKISIHHNKPWE